MSFLKTNHILHSNQHGFIAGKSTETAMIDLVDYVLTAINDGSNVSVIFLDFCKAFDLVNHRVLLNALYQYGIRGNSLNWIESFLSQRFQSVVINNHRSCQLPVNSGVPQGSNLGPLLLVIYGTA